MAEQIISGGTAKSVFVVDASSGVPIVPIPYHLLSAATTNATSLKSTTGVLYGYSLSNTNASARYFRLYDLAAAPTVGTSTIKHTVQVPANATLIRVYPNGLHFTNGIAFSATGAMGDTDTTAIGAGDLSIDLDYV